MSATTIGPRQAIAILNREFASLQQGLHTPVMLWGAPGVGKSQVVQQVADQHEVPLIDLRLSQLEPSDLRGIPFRHEREVVWATPSMLPQVGRDGERGILFLDEITSALPTVAAAAYQLILDRRIGDYHLPSGWMIVAAGNRVGDRGVAYAMPAPLANRFVHYEVEPVLADWLAWALRQDIDERLTAFIELRDDLLMAFDPRSDQQAFPSPRSWEFASRALSKFEDDPVLLAKGLQGAVGQAAAQALLDFISHPVPTVQDYLTGKVNQLPVDVASQLLFVSHALAWFERQGDNKKAAKVLVDILPGISVDAAAVKLVRSLRHRVGDSVLASPGFQRWALKVAPQWLNEEEWRGYLPH